MLRRRLLLTLSACVLAVLAASCASTPPLSIEDYAAAAGEASAEYVAESQQLSVTYQDKVSKGVSAIVETGSDTAIDEATTLVRTETVMYLALLDDAILRYIAAMESLAPPASVEALHDEYVEIAHSVQSTLPGLRDGISEAASIPDIQGALFTSGFSDGQAAWLARCEALEQGVRDAGRGVDLKCVRRDVMAAEGDSP